MRAGRVGLTAATHTIGFFDGESYQEALVRGSSWLRDLKGVTVAVSHGLAGRVIHGAHLGLTREQTLSLPVPQEIIWHLVEHRVGGISSCVSVINVFAREFTAK
jgi:broad specificity phosphatase PhoE